MDNSNLISLINSFSQKEIGIAQKWLANPLHNTRQDVCDLYDYLTNSITGFKAEYLDKELIWACLYPESKYNAGKLRQIVHFLYKSLESFLVYQELQADKFKQRFYLMEALRKRGLNKQYNQVAKQTQQLLTKHQEKDQNYLEANYQFSKINFRMAEDQKRVVSLDLQVISDDLDRQYLAEKMRLTCALNSHKAIYKINYKARLVNVLLEEIEQEESFQHPAIQVYYDIYQIQKGGEQADVYFKHLLDNLQNNHNLFKIEELRDLYLLAINYAIRRANTGEDAYVRQLFQLYRDGIERGILLRNKILSPWTYRNAAISGLRLEEYAWVSQFLENYKQYIIPNYRTDVYQECLAKLYYKQQFYDKAMTLLTQVSFKDILQQINAKTLLAKIYMELREFVALEALLESIRVYLRRKDLVGYHKENYTNIIILIQQLLKLNTFDRSAKVNLRQKIENTQPLTERAWLLEQLDAL